MIQYKYLTKNYYSLNCILQWLKTNKQQNPIKNKLNIFIPKYNISTSQVNYNDAGIIITKIKLEKIFSYEAIFFGKRNLLGSIDLVEINKSVNSNNYLEIKSMEISKFFINKKYIIENEYENIKISGSELIQDIMLKYIEQIAREKNHKRIYMRIENDNIRLKKLIKYGFNVSNQEYLKIKQNYVMIEKELY